MEGKFLQMIALTVILGIGMQWLAWGLKLPSILLLLLAGLVAGPVGGWIDPDALLGQALMPLISVSVALILFEGGLTLRYGELRQIGGVVRNLITLGAGLTMLLAALGVHLLLQWEPAQSLLLGAILTVSGPTVVSPLLRHIHPTRRVGSILKWEGILIDPVGALLAVLVYEAIRANLVWQDLPAKALAGFGMTLAIGIGLGFAGAWILILAFKQYWVPDFLQNPVALTMVVGGFALSNRLHPESGLLTATIMGIAMANQRQISIRHVLEFKENLRVLLLSGLFILLAARIQRHELMAIPWGRSLAFLGLLILVVRPAAVFVSTMRSPLPWRERGFLACLAPRGIVAAAIGSIFALKLQALGTPDADALVPVTFFVIVGTVILYGLLAKPVARMLEVSIPNPQGVLIVGAHSLARKIGDALQKHEFPLLMIDINRENIHAARMQGLTAVHDNVLREHVGEELDLEGIGKLLALTPNPEVNALAALHFAEFFGRREVYQLAAEKGSRSTDRTVSTELQGRTLFNEQATFAKLYQLVGEGAEVKTTPLTEEFNFTDFLEFHGPCAIPLFLITEKNRLVVLESQNPPDPRPPCQILSLQIPKQEDKVVSRE